MKPPQNSISKSWKSLELDVEYYQSLLDNEDIPEDQRQELLESLWNIVVQFIDMGFGVHPMQQANCNVEDKTQQLLTKIVCDFADEEFSSEKESILEGEVL